MTGPAPLGHPAYRLDGDKVLLGVKIDPALYGAFADIAYARGSTISDMIREYVASVVNGGGASG